MPSDLPPAAFLDPENPPAIRAEVEAGWSTSVQEVWEKLGGAPSLEARRKLWVSYVEAQRLDRMAWMEVEVRTTKAKVREKRNALARIMGADVVETAPKPKRPRKKKGETSDVTPAGK